MDEPKCAVVLLGPPGSGKTTLVRTLALRPHIQAIETGNLFAEEIRRGTPLGRQIEPYKSGGQLVPLEFLEQVMSTALENTQSNLILFDGFPRSIGQIELFFKLLKGKHLRLCGVLVLQLDLQTALHRLAGRRVCPQCGAIYNIYASPPKQDSICDRCGGRLIQRPDDRTEVVQERFKSYERETIPVVELFRREFGNVTWEESAASAPDELADRIWQRLTNAIPHLASNVTRPPAPG